MSLAYKLWKIGSVLGEEDIKKAIKDNPEIKNKQVGFRIALPNHELNFFCPCIALSTSIKKIKKVFRLLITKVLNIVRTK